SAHRDCRLLDSSLSQRSSYSAQESARRPCSRRSTESLLPLLQEMACSLMNSFLEARSMAAPIVASFTFCRRPWRAQRRPIPSPWWKSTGRGRVENRFQSRSETLLPGWIRARSHPDSASPAEISRLSDTRLDWAEPLPHSPGSITSYL